MYYQPKIEYHQDEEHSFYHLKPVSRDPKATLYFYHGWGSSAKRQIFRGSIFALYGYEVILPDAIHHGYWMESGFKYSDEETFAAYFWKTIQNNVEGFSQLKEKASKLGALNHHIAVGGHSMGAYTGAGILAKEKDCICGILYNGSCYWKKSIERMKNLAGPERSQYLDLAFAESHDPTMSCDLLKKKFIYLANGACDKTVDPEENKLFCEEFLDSSERLIRVKYSEIGHLISDGMLRDGIQFLDNWIKTLSKNS